MSRIVKLLTPAMFILIHELGEKFQKLPGSAGSADSQHILRNQNTTGVVIKMPLALDNTITDSATNSKVQMGFKEMPGPYSMSMQPKFFNRRQPSSSPTKESCPAFSNPRMNHQNPAPKYCRFDAEICLPELHAHRFAAEKVPGYTYCEENHLKQAHFTQTVK